MPCLAQDSYFFALKWNLSGNNQYPVHLNLVFCILSAFTILKLLHHIDIRDTFLILKLSLIHIEIFRKQGVESKFRCSQGLLKLFICFIRLELNIKSFQGLEFLIGAQFYNTCSGFQTWLWLKRKFIAPVHILQFCHWISCSD